MVQESKKVMKVVHVNKEPYDVYIGRPGPWGNPFVIGQDGNREEVVEKYRVWLLAQPELVVKAKVDLTDKVLGCWCAPLSCHGDVLIEVIK